MSEFRLTVDATTQPVTTSEPDWSTIAWNAAERGVLARLETRDRFAWDEQFLEGLRDPHTGANPTGWIILPGSMIVSPWRVVVEIPATPRTIGGIIG